MYLRDISQQRGDRRGIKTKLQRYNLHLTKGQKIEYLKIKRRSYQTWEKRRLDQTKDIDFDIKGLRGFITKFQGAKTYPPPFFILIDHQTIEGLTSNIPGPGTDKRS